MIKVITTVGTSLLENYKKISGKNDSDLIGSIYSFDKDFHTNNNPDDLDESDLNKLIENIKNQFFQGYKKEDGEFKSQKDTINEDASAEIKSIIEIQKEVGEKIQVHLIASDTIASEKCAELIKDFFEEVYDKNKGKFSVCFSTSNANQSDKIKGLQVWNSETYETEGILNLSNRIYQIYQSRDSLSMKNKYNQEIKKLRENKNHEDADKKEEEMYEKINNIKYDCILNITGGYKGVIPYISTISQLMKMNVFYIFEDSNKLIQIPNLEIQFDWNIAEKYYYYLTDISSNVVVKNNILKILFEKKLIKKNSKNEYNGLSGYGNFFKSFIEQEMPISKDNFGFAIEYKIYEYLIEKEYKNPSKYKYIEHSNEDMNRWHFKNNPFIKEKGTEIDLVLKKENIKINNNNRYIACEVKSLFQIENEKSLSEVIYQTKKRIEFMERDKCLSDEYHLYIYTFNEYKFNNISKKLTENINKIKDTLNNKINLFKVFIVHVNLENEKQDNLYMQFMQNKLDSNSIKEIKI
ncbi:MAG: hypothetical protein KBA47_00260 [Caldisericia bacterium]|nr:hypothetical protein [Caldisericia bacterium]